MTTSYQGNVFHEYYVDDDEEETEGDEDDELLGHKHTSIHKEWLKEKENGKGKGNQRV